MRAGWVRVEDVAVSMLGHATWLGNMGGEVRRAGFATGDEVRLGCSRAHAGGLDGRKGTGCGLCPYVRARWARALAGVRAGWANGL